MKINRGILPNGRIGIAVSGGADSVALAFLLTKGGKKRRVDKRFVILHVDHGLRRESKSEYRFVRALAARLGVPFKGCHTHVEPRPGESLEMAARRVRLDFFGKCMSSLGLDAIATGHHMDDVAETFLMRIRRASGPQGLAGIKEKSEVGAIRFVRPLLGCRDAELKAYLRKYGETWCEDASNDDTTIERNKVRHEVIPFLEATLDHKLVEHIGRICAQLTRVSACALCLLAVAGASGETVFPLVSNHAPEAAIVRTGNSRVNKDIAYFTNAIFRATGAALPVVGRQDESRRTLSFVLEKRPIPTEDAWRIEFPATNCMLVVGTETSCRWALNHILEEQCGLVACFSGPHGTHYGRAVTIALPMKRHSGDSAYKLQRYFWREDGEWERAVGGKRYLGAVNFGEFCGHNLYNLLPPSKYGKDPWREKVMPMNEKGVRLAPARGDNVFWQPCYASPDAVREIVANACDYLRAHPDSGALSLAQTDGEGYCRCPKCEEMNGGFGRMSHFLPKYEDHSPSYYRFVNTLAEEITKEFPHVILGCLSYCGTCDPPPFKMHPNVLVQVCEDIFQYNDPEMAGKLDARMAAWCEKANYVGHYDYPYGADRYYLPRMCTRHIDRAFKRKLVHPQINYYFAESSPFEGDGPKKWFMYRCLTDPSCDRLTELRRWYRACGGEEAAPHLEDYYETWERFWMGPAIKKTKWYASIKGAYCDFDDTSWTTAVDKDVLAGTTASLERAWDAVRRSGDADQIYRVELIKRYHDYGVARLKWSTQTIDGKPDPMARTANEATRFVEALAGDYGETCSQIERLTSEICGAKYAKPFDFGYRGEEYLWKCAIETFRAVSLENQNASQYYMSSLATHYRDPLVVAAMNAARESSHTPRRFRLLFEGLLGRTAWQPYANARELSRTDHAATCENLSDGAFRLVGRNGGWCGTVRIYGVAPGYWYRMRVRARAGRDFAKPVRTGVMLRVPGTRYGPLAKVEVNPGETAEYMSIICLSQRDSRIELYLDADNLPAGSGLDIVSLEFDRIPVEGD